MRREIKEKLKECEGCQELFYSKWDSSKVRWASYCQTCINNHVWWKRRQSK